MPQGLVVCNSITGQLLSTKIKVPAARMRILEMETPTVVDGG